MPWTWTEYELNMHWICSTNRIYTQWVSSRTDNSLLANRWAHKRSLSPFFKNSTGLDGLEEDKTVSYGLQPNGPVSKRTGGVERSLTFFRAKNIHSVLHTHTHESITNSNISQTIRFSTNPPSLRRLSRYRWCWRWGGQLKKATNRTEGLSWSLPGREEFNRATLKHWEW